MRERTMDHGTLHPGTLREPPGPREIGDFVGWVLATLRGSGCRVTARPELTGPRADCNWIAIRGMRATP